MINTTEIKRRYAKGQHHKANYLANTARKIAKEYGIPHGTMHDCLYKGRKCRAITQEQFEDAQRRVKYSYEQKALYEQHSPRVIRDRYRIGEHTLREMVRDSMLPEDPIRKFLTMRLVA